MSDDKNGIQEIRIQKREESDIENGIDFYKTLFNYFLFFHFASLRGYEFFISNTLVTEPKFLSILKTRITLFLNSRVSSLLIGHLLEKVMENVGNYLLKMRITGTPSSTGPNRWGWVKNVCHCFSFVDTQLCCPFQRITWSFHRKVGGKQDLGEWWNKSSKHQGIKSPLLKITFFIKPQFIHLSIEI